MNFFEPTHVSAHEVYVLTPTEVHSAVGLTSPNPLVAIKAQEFQFLTWFVCGLVVFLLLLYFSISPLFERVFNSAIRKLKKFAPLIGRVTLGLSLFASGFYHATFGPELPLSNLTSQTEVAGWALMIAGGLVCFNYFAKLIVGLGIIFFVYLGYIYHLYILNYLNYFGEMVLVLILHSDKEQFKKYAFLFLRVCFGIAVFFASFYAKFIHSNLALDTVRDYHLTDYFHFTPLFLVLGAFIVEAVIGICFAIGFQIRFVAILFTFFLTLSILFFGEAVWPHIILFGVNIALFAHGYDKYTLETFLFQRKRFGEPVL